MKNRNLAHSDNWATPPFFYEELNQEFGFDFDPCPFNHDLNLFNGLEIEWGSMNFVNPPYSEKKATGYLKTSFVKKAIEQASKGKVSVLLIPVSTSTKLFHNYILPNKKEIRYPKGRIPFIGINTKGEYVNWHLWKNEAPEGAIHVKNSGMHDSMIVIFDKESVTKVP